MGNTPTQDQAVSASLKSPAFQSYRWMLNVMQRVFSQVTIGAFNNDHIPLTHLEQDAAAGSMM